MDYDIKNRLKTWSLQLFMDVCMVRLPIANVKALAELTVTVSSLDFPVHSPSAVAVFVDSNVCCLGCFHPRDMMRKLCLV